MKRVLCFLLLLSMLAFAACGGESTADSSTADRSETQSVADSSAAAPETAIAPDISGMTAEQAEQALKDAGFEVRVRKKNYDDVPVGEVAGMDLTAGKEYDYGDVCYLYISSGKTLGAQALEYKQGALVANREVLDVGANSDYTPLNYEYMKAAWLSQYDMNDVYVDGAFQRAEDDFTQRIETLFGGLAELGLNTLFVQLRPNGDSMYPSAYYCPSSYAVGSYGADFTYDPLKIMVDVAHKHNLSIHGWINPLRCMDVNAIDLINISYGLRDFEQNHMDDYVVKYDGKFYLNPGREEVRQLIINGAAEIARYYDIDGIHIDDYFYPTTESSFDKASFLDQTEYLSVADFRKASLNALVGGIYSAVKAENPKLIFGVSPAGQPGAVRKAYADIDTWLSTEGYLDYIMPQLYWGFELRGSEFDKLYRNWNSLIKIDIKLIPGLSLSRAASGETSEWVNNKDVLKRCVEYANGFGGKGFSLFSSDSILSAFDGSRVPNTLEEMDNLLDYVNQIEDTPIE
ncbi:MAG: family 10 glycosylhydrolase [Clostridia bacterium]|nr:family 10 glycosylhydrolase [Clostridia bacterium]